MAAASDFAELSTLRAQLEELTARVVAVGDRYRDTDDSAIAAELDQAERALRGAVRALDRAGGMLSGEEMERSRAPERGTAERNQPAG
jgi:hypothetical protein